MSTSRDVRESEGEGSVTDEESEVLEALFGEGFARFNDYGMGDLLKALRKGYELGCLDGLRAEIERHGW